MNEMERTQQSDGRDGVTENRLKSGVIRRTRRRRPAVGVGAGAVAYRPTEIAGSPYASTATATRPDALQLFDPEPFATAAIPEFTIEVAPEPAAPVEAETAPIDTTEEGETASPEGAAAQAAEGAEAVEETAESAEETVAEAGEAVSEAGPSEGVEPIAEDSSAAADLTSEPREQGVAAIRARRTLLDLPPRTPHREPAGQRVLAVRPRRRRFRVSAPSRTPRSGLRRTRSVLS